MENEGEVTEEQASRLSAHLFHTTRMSYAMTGERRSEVLTFAAHDVAVVLIMLELSGHGSCFDQLANITTHMSEVMEQVFTSDECEGLRGLIAELATNTEPEKGES